jgi:hypothetical protein
MEASDLWALRSQIERQTAEDIAAIDAELDRWEPIACAVCGIEDLAYRGEPFITWGNRGGYMLCPNHLVKFDRKGTPEEEKFNQFAKDQQIKEIFA